MLYLEDYLEMIEHLPQELRDRFTEMRELDLSVQNDSDTIDKRIRSFFGQCRRGELNGNQADTQYEAIKKDYLKTLEDSEEKVQLANQIYELVDRYLKRLDNELLKFKCELEADNQGITELLEKRSLELDGSSVAATQKENRYFGQISQQSSRGGALPPADRIRLKLEKRRDSGAALVHPLEKRALSSGLTTPILRPTTPNLTHVLQSSSSMGGSSALTNNILAQAATQALEKTGQMQYGRRTATFKASLAATQNTSSSSSGMNATGHEMLMGCDIPLDPNAVSFSLANQQKRYKKKMSLGGASSSPQTSSSHLLHQIQTQSNDSDELMPSSYVNKDGMMVEQTAEGEWTYDPNEPRYCICNQVSYGEMVACDNSECQLEWFHYPCVGITTSPKGKWYCPMCTKSRKKNNKTAL